MKILSRVVAVVALIARAAADTNVAGPFALHVTGRTDPSIDGYVYACLADVPTDDLCYSSGLCYFEGSLSKSWQFYYNYTVLESNTYPGTLGSLFIYDGVLVKVPSFMHIYSNWASNVNVVLFPCGTENGTLISLDFDTGFFYMGSLFDDTHGNATLPSLDNPRNISNFHLCYQWTGRYWYHTIAWVSGYEGVTPQNPSCQPVNLGVESFWSST
ncbi:hypothetical protein GGR51DRAFT_573559 [Nemania sp. FL0031]|nr:hypothetical protein GGR51DRAFT_573559 [Nemania sp. FL0031]